MYAFLCLVTKNVDSSSTPYNDILNESKSHKPGFLSKYLGVNICPFVIKGTLCPSDFACDMISPKPELVNGSNPPDIDSVEYFGILEIISLNLWLPSFIILPLYAAF